MDQVSREQHRLELEQRTISQGIRASQELSLLQVAMERSLSSAEVAAADDSEVARIPPPPPALPCLAPSHPILHIPRLLRSPRP